MKYTKYLFGAIALASSLGFTACSDKFMEDLNADPTKVTSLDPNAQLTTAELQIYGDLGLMHIYRDYQYAFTQQLMGCWNTTNYGGQHRPDDNEMRRLWDALYPTAIKNLTDAIYNSKDVKSRNNINAVCRIMRVYAMSLITDTYGDVPYFEAGMGYIDGVTLPKYDTQKEIYYDFFKELKEAVAQFDPSLDRITGDLIYNGDIDNGKHRANSLRLRFAMRLCDVDPAKAQEEFEAAVNDPGGLIATPAQDALVKHMEVAFSFGEDAFRDYRCNALAELFFGNDPVNNPTYVCSTFYDWMDWKNDPRLNMICRFYYDKTMGASSTEGRVDLTDEMSSMGITPDPCHPGEYSWDRWPAGYWSPTIESLQKSNPSLNPQLDREVRPKLANGFLKGNNPGVIFTAAEVLFLRAEAMVRGWNAGTGTAEDLYKEGVRNTFTLLVNHFGCANPGSETIELYLDNGGAFGAVPAAQISCINEQAWVLHLTNPSECWANVRRSGYPRLSSPTDYVGETVVPDRDIPVRLCYPALEGEYNTDNYKVALKRMGGVDSWHTNVWWDAQ